MDVIEQKRQEIESEILDLLPEVESQIKHPRLKVLIAQRSALRTTQELVGPLIVSFNGHGTGKSDALLALVDSGVAITPAALPESGRYDKGRCDCRNPTNVPRRTAR